MPIYHILLSDDVINLCGKIQIENPAIMEDKQCKQMERFLAMAQESEYFLSSDDINLNKYIK